MNRLTGLLLVILHFTHCNAQTSQKTGHLLNEKEWFEGRISLADGEELKGLVRYDNKIGLLTFNDGASTKTFRERSVLGFGFFDKSIQKQRTFYVLEFSEQGSNVKDLAFFEALREYKSFAILIKSGPVEVQQNFGSADYSVPGAAIPIPSTASTQTNPIVSQTETVYIMNDKGDVLPYFQMTTKKRNGKDGKTKNKMIQEDLIVEYVTKPIYDKLVAYAEENELKFQQKEDFLKILEYYDRLRLN